MLAVRHRRRSRKAAIAPKDPFVRHFLATDFFPQRLPARSVKTNQDELIRLRGRRAALAFAAHRRTFTKLALRPLSFFAGRAFPRRWSLAFALIECRRGRIVAFCRNRRLNENLVAPNNRRRSSIARNTNFPSDVRVLVPLHRRIAGGRRTRPKWTAPLCPILQRQAFQRLR